MKPLEILKKCSIASQKPAIEANNMSNAIEEDIFESMMHAKALWDGGSGSADNDYDMVWVTQNQARRVQKHSMQC